MNEEISCLRCKAAIDSSLDTCPHCGEKVTDFQRTYSGRLLDGKYEIIDRLGLGGMGEIFKVRHIHLNELRVVKVMRANVAQDDQGLQRFLQEARTSTMIKHRNLAMLYDFSTLDDGSYYMVWEFIDGTNIQKWTGQNGPMPPRLAMEIAIQSLSGIEHLHQMGIIHRDISPENIMLTQDYQGKLLAKVIDFGIAKQMAEGEGGQGLTQTGMFLGKLKYASPEQAGFMREGEAIDGRTDLYSFGIVLYEMLAGRAPFHATNPHGYILKHATEKPPAVSTLNPDVQVPAKLEAVLFKSLEKDREARHKNAGEFISELEALRPEIAPDSKFGLGEKMVTLSGAQTLAELPKPTRTGQTTGGTFAGGTMGGGTTGAGKKTTNAPRPNAANEATIIESKVGAGTFPGRTMAGSNEATINERITMPEAEATVIEGKVNTATVAGGPRQKKGPQPSSAGATMMDTPLPQEEKKKTGMIVAIAATLLLLIGGGAYMFTRTKVVDPTPVDPTATSATTGAEIAVGGDEGQRVPMSERPPIDPNKGMVWLNATPYGELERLENLTTKKQVELSANDKSTPLRLELDPGKYRATLKSPEGKQSTLDIMVEVNELKRYTRNLGQVNIDEISEELVK